MKTLIAGLLIVLTITSAQAQVVSPQAQQMQGAQRLGDSVSRDGRAGGASAVKSDDKAYNAALKNLPDKQYDPWRGVR
jgi:hypothetical protein